MGYQFITKYIWQAIGDLLRNYERRVHVGVKKGLIHFWNLNGEKIIPFCKCTVLQQSVIYMYHAILVKAHTYDKYLSPRTPPQIKSNVHIVKMKPVL